MARALIIGGNRFLGQELAFRLLAQGHQLTLLNRGTLASAVGPRAEHLQADRGTDAFDAALRGRSFDAVFDFALFDEAQARRAARVLEGRCGHYVMISTGQVYLVRERCGFPAREDDFDGPLLPEPQGDADRQEWRYGVDKRQAEAALLESGLPVTAVRVPMVHGPGDHHRRIEGVVRRLVERGPLLVARPEAPARHIFSLPLTRALAALMGNPKTFRRAYNLSQDETPTVVQLVRQIAEVLGVLPEILSVSDEELQRRGLTAVEACPFSGRWMSCLDATRAKVELGFVHPPLRELLPVTVASILSRLPAEPPPRDQKRALELQLAQELKRR